MTMEVEILENEILELKEKCEKLELKVGQAYIDGYNAGKSELKKSFVDLQKTLDKINIV